MKKHFIFLFLLVSLFGFHKAQATTMIIYCNPGPCADPDNSFYLVGNLEAVSYTAGEQVTFAASLTSDDHPINGACPSFVGGINGANYTSNVFSGCVGDGSFDPQAGVYETGKILGNAPAVTGTFDMAASANGYSGDTDSKTLLVTGGGASVDLQISQRVQDAFGSLFSHALAQTKSVTQGKNTQPSGITVAHVNLSNTELTKVSADNYYVSFILANEGEAQSDVKYTLALVDAKDKVVSLQTFDKTITLQKGKLFFVSEKLVTPKGISGTFTVRAQAQTTTGLPLGFGATGKLTLTGDSKLPSLTSCVANKKAYTTNQVLPVDCALFATKNMGDYVVTSKVFLRNEPQPLQTVSAEIKGAKASPTIENLTAPGVYTIRTSLYERTGNPVGKEIVEQFVVKGTTVSILNLMLDANRYRTNDIAHAVASFSVFSTEPRTSPLRVVTSLVGRGGACADVQTQNLTRPAIEVALPVTSFCKNPSLTVQVLDDKNTILANKTITLVSAQPDFKTLAGYGVALLALLLVTYLLIEHAHRHGAESLVKKFSRRK
jgi:hypothetical protein